MSSTLTHKRFDFGQAEPSQNQSPLRANDQSPSKRPSLGKRASRAVARFLVTFCIGVSAALAWLSYGDAAREMIASSAPELAWLAPQATAPQAAPPQMSAPAALSPGQQQLNAISLGVADLRQTVEQLGARLTASQDQITQEITLLRAVEQHLVDKISAPSSTSATAPTHKPVPPIATRQPAVR